jgi:hypothetical protein
MKPFTAKFNLTPDQIRAGKWATENGWLPDPDRSPVNNGDGSWTYQMVQASSVQESIPLGVGILANIQQFATRITGADLEKLVADLNPEKKAKPTGTAFPFVIKPKPGDEIRVRRTMDQASDNRPLRKGEIKKLGKGEYATDAPNRQMRRQQDRANKKAAERRARLDAQLPPELVARRKHHAWLDSLRKILNKVGNPLEATKQTERGRSVWVRI